MAGRFEFSLPERPARDGWFRIGTVDVTTTALLVGLGVLSMFVYAVDPMLVFKGTFSSTLVRQGDLWRLATWPLVNPPVDIWAVLPLVFFWFVGHRVEDVVGRKPFTALIAATTLIPAALVTLLDVANDGRSGRWSTVAFGLSVLLIGLFVVYVLEYPGAQFFFGIPAWVLAAVFVGLDVLRLVGGRLWAQLLLELFVIAVACIGARQVGMLEALGFVPRVGRGPARHRASTPRPARGPRPDRPPRLRGRAKAAPGRVVEGPWTPTGPTPLEQAELDVLLEKISAGGIDSLTPQERERLQALSRRLRDR
ncbi:MAG: rhomboid family intramembrane serine protease [Actinobacteria bacterium]|nr:rhomboid family intramembrane serine protease [Actinomycetota bacterium]